MNALGIKDKFLQFYLKGLRLECATRNWGTFRSSITSIYSIETTNLNHLTTLNPLNITVIYLQTFLSVLKRETVYGAIEVFGVACLTRFVILLDTSENS